MIKVALQPEDRPGGVVKASHNKAGVLAGIMP